MSGQALPDLGDRHVDAPIVCNITRFGLRGARFLPSTYRDFRRVVRAAGASETPGLLRCVFLVENPTTAYSLSIWQDYDAIGHFGTNVPSHAEVAGHVFRRLAFEPDRGPELWSTKWRLMSVTNNLNWEDLDLRRVIAERGMT